MRLDTYCCLIFYGLTLIHLIDLLSQIIQIMCDIYENIYKCKGILLFSWVEKRHTLHSCLESTHRLNLGCRKGKAH